MKITTELEGMANNTASSQAISNLIGEDGYTLLHYAAKKNIDIALYLVNKGNDINAVDNNGYNPLHKAADNGNINIVQYLVDKGCDINAVDNDGNSPLHEAAMNGNIETVNYLKALSYAILLIMSIKLDS
ncbi:hypothetical protein IE077_002721, partial [Cardiosporidium cionae]